MPGLRLVKIIKGNPTTQELELNYNGRRDAHKGDRIQWVINGNSGVHSIVEILGKGNWSAIWQSLPAPVGSSGVWRGVLKTTAPINTEYQYLIRWTAKANGDVLTQDPLIRIRPTGVIIPPDQFFLVGKVITQLITFLLMLTGISLFILWLKKRKDN